MVVTYKLDQFGVKSLLRRLDPKRMLRSRDQALNKGSRLIIKVIRAESRVKSGHYKDQWFTRKHGESHTIVNTSGYGDFVTGRTMATTLQGGGRRGAGAAFMKKIRRENSMRVRNIMQEMLRDIVRG